MAPKRSARNIALLFLGIFAWWSTALLITMRPEMFLAESAWTLDEAADPQVAGKGGLGESENSSWKHWKRSIWKRNRERPSRDRFLSPSGKYLAVIESLQVPFNRARIQIIDVKTGRPKGIIKFRGLLWAGWARTDVLEVLTSARPLFDLAGLFSADTTAWTRLSPTAQSLSTLMLPQTLSFSGESADTEILVVSDGATTKILTLNGSEGTISEVAQGPEEPSIGSWYLGAGAVVVQLNDMTARGKALLIENHRAVQIPASGRIFQSSDTPHFIFGQFLDFVAARRELTTVYKTPLQGQGAAEGFIPLPATRPIVVRSRQDGRPFYVRPDCSTCGTRQLGYQFKKISPHETFMLWVWNGATWRDLGEIVYTGRSTLYATNLYNDSLWESFIDFHRGIAAYKRNGETFLYDATIDQEVPVQECPAENNGTFLEESGGQSGIFFMCQQNHPGGDGFKGFLYQPGSGRIRENFSWSEHLANKLKKASLLRFETNGSSVWASEQKIFRVSAHGRVLQIWPTDPSGP